MPKGVYKHKKGYNRPPFTKDWKEKISRAHKGKKLSEEHKKKIGEASKGRQGHWLGKKHSKETRKKISEAGKGEKNSNWRGGTQYKPYPVDWTNTLKRSIRERDKYTCKMCGLPQTEITFDIHHIDYDKKNCNPNNLIMLCNICHSKTNGRRKHWIKYFKLLLLNK